jgi:hypothetical protein
MFLQHPCPLSDGQSDAWPMFDDAVKDATRFIQAAAGKY